MHTIFYLLINPSALPRDLSIVNFHFRVGVYIHKCNVTLSHLRSKELQRIHLPCIPLHRETTKCTLVYIEMHMYPGKLVALQKSRPSSGTALFVLKRLKLDRQTINRQILEIS